MGPNLAILAFQNQNTNWTWDPTLEYLHSKLKHTLNLGPNQVQYLHQTKIHTKPRTQPCNTYIPKLKHPLDYSYNTHI
jgi:hypothetical protein